MSSNNLVSYRRHLPHRFRPESTIFITWRLCDSLPQQVVARAKIKRERFLQEHPQPWSPATEKAFHRRFSRNIDRWLDRGVGSCVLRCPPCAKVVSDALHFFDKERYDLDSFVVMPNHVHVLLTLRPDWSLPNVAHSIKSYTAKKVNALTGSGGHLWQQEVWDRMVRSPAHLYKCREYIIENPVNARLAKGQYILYVPD